MIHTSVVDGNRPPWATRETACARHGRLEHLADVRPIRLGQHGKTAERRVPSGFDLADHPRRDREPLGGMLLGPTATLAQLCKTSTDVSKQAIDARHLRNEAPLALVEKAL
jgi:hypothetical protein